MMCNEQNTHTKRYAYTITYLFPQSELYIHRTKRAAMFVSCPANMSIFVQDQALSGQLSTNTCHIDRNSHTRKPILSP